MKKRVLIGLGFLLMLFLLSLVVKSESHSHTKKISDDVSVSILPIESKNYAELVGAEEGEVEEFDEFHYFLLRLSENSNSQSELFKELHSKSTLGGSIKYFSEGITQDLYLITKRDTLKCSMSHWERTYNIRKDITISLAFKKQTNDKPIKFIWNDNLIEGIPIKFNL